VNAVTSSTTTSKRGPLKLAPHTLINAGDVATALTLALLAPLSWLLPERIWHPVCRALGRLHIAIRGSKASDIAGHEALRLLALDPFQLERSFMATVYEETLHTLRGQLPAVWKPKIVVRGREHLDTALRSGRGAILWVCPCSFAELILKRGLHGEGINLTNLRSKSHPYSGTSFGTHLLNPIRTRVEDRYLEGTVVLYPKGGAVALRELQMKLRKNKVVSVFAIAASDRPFEVPCLGGLLSLALGAPTLAGVSRAPLLPTCVLPSSSGGFEILIEAPIPTGNARAQERSHEFLARQYARSVETWVARRPDVWRGWFSRSLWRPSDRPSV